MENEEFSGFIVSQTPLSNNEENERFLRSCGILPADDPFIIDPRGYALELVERGVVSADHLLLCALKYMSHEGVRGMLDANELSPRFEGADE